MSGRAIAMAGLVLMALPGCGRSFTPGLVHQQAQEAEIRRQGGDVAIGLYHEAVEAGAFAMLTGRVYEERHKPDAADMPLDGTVLLLLPRSETFLDTLETIKRHARDSIDSYRDAASAVRRAREAYETALLREGGGDLAQGATVNEDGSFAFPSLPAGDWLLVGAYTKFGKMASVPTPGRTRTGPVAGSPDRFLPQPRLVSHSYVTLWLHELTVKPGDAATVALTDRNAWMTGVVEDTQTPVFRASPPIVVPGSTGSSVLGTSGNSGIGSSGGPTLSPSR